MKPNENTMLPGETGSRGDTTRSAGWFHVLGYTAERPRGFCPVVDELIIIQGRKQLEKLFRRWEKMALAVV